MRTRLAFGFVVLAFATVASLRADDHGGSSTELEGTVTALPASGLVGDWTIAERIVHVSSATKIETEGGPPAVGSFAEVKGSVRGDGSIDAAELEVKSQAPGGVEPPEAHFVGTIDTLPASGLLGDWTVSGKIVHVTAATRLETEDGTPAAGATVEVRGTLLSDGSVSATRIEVRAAAPGNPANGVDFRGAVDTLPAGLVGDWTVGGKTVHVTAVTRLETEDHGTFSVGAFVEVEGTARADGSVDAASIELKFSPGAAPEVEIHGAVEALSADPAFVGDWKVAGVTVHVTATTRIHTEDGTLTLGAFVEVKGTRRADGSIDAERIELLWAPPTAGSAKTAVSFFPSVAHAGGRNGAFFTTSVTLANRADVRVEVEARFHGHDRDGRAPQVRAFSLAPQETRTIDDVLGTLFGAASDFGSLEIASNSGALAVSSRTGAAGAGGRFGQDVPAAGRDDLVREGVSRVLAGVRQESGVRTNLVLANAGEIETDVEVELDGPDGSALGSIRITLRPLEMRQINDVVRALGAGDGFRDGRLRLSTPTANGAFATLASEIDNGTNDPRTLWPR
jgi:hypothetical protein